MQIFCTHRCKLEGRIIPNLHAKENHIRWLNILDGRYTLALPRTVQNSLVRASIPIISVDVLFFWDRGVRTCRGSYKWEQPPSFLDFFNHIHIWTWPCRFNISPPLYQRIPSAGSNIMAPCQNFPNIPSEHNMELKKPSPCHDGLTPPDSPTKGTVTSQAIVKDLKYLFGVFLEKVIDLTNREPPNTPASEDLSPSGPDMVQRVLECATAELSIATDSSQSSYTSDEQENLPGSDDFDPKHPICTTPDDFKSFEKWASTPQFKTVVETYEPPTPLPMPL